MANLGEYVLIPINKNLLKEVARMGAAEALAQAGITAGEITYRRAQQIYGNWFTEAVAQGRLKPIRVGTARNSARYFSLTSLLALRAADESAAQIQAIL